jgi:NAD(P)-dependent dehydrogenase (short-subunit alcohol dehydrogenase family)
MLEPLPLSPLESPPAHPIDMHGKNILITGATSGIGEAAARQLYALGANVILHGRSPIRTEAAIDRIQEAVPGNPGKLDILVADFAVMEDVYHMTEAFKARYKRLDVLVNNAGAFFIRRQVTPDGVEMTFAVNHLAHFLLTRQLLELLKASAPSRIINVSSGSHFKAKLDFSNLNLEKGYSGALAYANAKLCNVWFTFEMARKLRRMPDIAVTSNAMNPGWVATNIGKNNGWFFKAGIGAMHTIPLTRHRMRDPDEGADTIVYLATSPEAAEFNGKYFVDKVPVATSVPSYDHDAAANLWGLSELLLQRSVPALATRVEPTFDEPAPAPSLPESP